MPTTAMRAPGIFLLTRSQPDDVARTAIDTARVGTLVSPAAMARSALRELLEGRAAALADPEHAADLAHRDLDADAGQEADEHAVGQEVGDEPEPDDPRDDHEHART